MKALPNEEVGRLYSEQEGALVGEILRSVPAAWPKDWAKKAFTRLRGAPVIREGEEPFFYSWLLFHANPGKGETAGAAFRRRRGAELSPIARRWLDSQIDAHLTILEILAVKPEIGLDVRDTLTGATHFIHERLATRTLRPRAFVLARLVRFEGVTFLGSIYLRSLPPHAGRELAEDARAAMGIESEDEFVGPESLRSEEATSLLVELWEDELEEIANAPLPELTNTSGDPLLMTRDRFDFAPEDRKRVIAALRTIPSSSHARDRSVIDFTSGKGAKSVILGSAEVRADRFVVTTNSLRRADELREQIDFACGSLARHRVRDHEDPQNALAAGAGTAPPAKPRAPNPPEISAALLAHKNSYYASWPDAPVPALQGKTPRQAVKSPSGRKAVEAILAEIEYGEASSPQGERFDVEILRRALGLSKGEPIATAEDEPEATEEFDGLYVLRVGPLPIRGKAAHAYVGVEADGTILPPIIERSPEKALREMATRAPRGTTLACDRTLIAAAKKHGFVEAPMPRSALHAWTSLALSFALPPDAPPHFAPEFAEALGEIAGALYRAAPWRHWHGDQPVELSLTTPAGTRKLAVSILGDAGEVLGFAVYEPPMMAGILDGTVTPDRAESVALWLEREPAFAAAAFEASQRVPLVPMPVRIRRGKASTPTDRETFELIAIGRALSGLRPDSRTATGEMRFDDGARVTATVKAPVPD